jgi:hypothetical protein
MPHFSKPAEGSWTEHYGIDTGPVSYEDSISPAHYQLERDAIFRRTWLNVGRVEQLPRNGSYFAKELDAARTSVVVLRDMGGEVRAFHNICRHRGNKLVWNDYPRVARRLRAGTVSVNGGMYYGPDAPFGGYKQSGIGREMGVAGLEEYLEAKTIARPAG